MRPRWFKPLGLLLLEIGYRLGWSTGGGVGYLNRLCPLCERSQARLDLLDEPLNLIISAKNTLRTRSSPEAVAGAGAPKAEV